MKHCVTAIVLTVVEIKYWSWLFFACPSIVHKVTMDKATAFSFIFNYNNIKNDLIFKFIATFLKFFS